MKKSLLSGLVVGVLAATAGVAHADPEHVKAVLLTVIFDNATGDVVQYFQNGFPTGDACTAAMAGIAAEATKKAGSDAHVGMSLCMSDSTVIKTPDKGPTTKVSAEPTLHIVHSPCARWYDYMLTMGHIEGDAAMFCSTI